MTFKLLTEWHLELPSLKVSCIGSSQSTLVKATLFEVTCHTSRLKRRIIGIRDADMTQVETARPLDVPHCVVSRLLKRQNGDWQC